MTSSRVDLEIDVFKTKTHQSPAFSNYYYTPKQSRYYSFSSRYQAPTLEKPSKFHHYYSTQRSYHTGSPRTAFPKPDSPMRYVPKRTDSFDINSPRTEYSKIQSPRTVSSRVTSSEVTSPVYLKELSRIDSPKVDFYKTDSPKTISPIIVCSEPKLSKHEMKKYKVNDSKEKPDLKDLMIVTDISIARDVIMNGFSFERKFYEKTIKLNMLVKESWATQLGILESLINLNDYLEKNDIDTSEICIMCPKYMRKYDIQAGGGGKLKKRFRVDSETGESKWIYEEFSEAAMRELNEELRIHSDKIILMFEGKYTSDKGRDDLTIVTKIFGTRITDCIPIMKFNPKNFIEGRHNVRDVLTSRVGYIPWGTISECFDLLVRIEVANKRSEILDEIDTISIVSLRKAIEIAKCANGHFFETVTKVHYKNPKSFSF